MSEPRIDKVVLVCPNDGCNQKLAVPHTSETLQVTCPKCGIRFTFPDEVSARRSASRGRRKSAAVPQTRPWVRWFARTIDGLVAGVVFGVVLAFVYPEAFDLADMVFYSGLLLVWVFAEALFLAAFGKTPGKWLLRTRVQDRRGRRPSFSTALQRSFEVWWRGLGLGLPIVSFVTQIVGYRRLKKDGVTPWDKRAGLVVCHERIGFARVAVIVLALVGATYFIGRVGYEPTSPEESLREILEQCHGEIHILPSPPSTARQLWQDIASRTFGSEGRRDAVNLSTAELAKRYRDCVLAIEAQDRNGEPLGTASGVLISQTGAVVTNRHVVVGARRIVVRLPGGWRCDSPRIVADYPAIDTVILLAQDLPRRASVVPMGNSDDLQVGERVVAIGNPLGLEGSVSEGIVSALRDVPGLERVRLLQTTAPISPGSSGGGLFNGRGELVGITVIASRSGFAQNVNFAIPVCEILRRLERSAEGGP